MGKSETHVTRRLEALDQSLDARFGPSLNAGLISFTPSLGASFITEQGVLRYVTAQSIVALPQDVTLMSPRIEFWFPLDDATRKVQSSSVQSAPEISPIGAG